jgi:N-acetylneuraminate synthase
MQLTDSIMLGSSTYRAYENPLIIAEISANHQKSLDNTLQLITQAAKAGADAVKLQTYTPNTITFNGSSDSYKIQGNAWSGETLYSLYEKAYLPWEMHKPIFDYCKSIGIHCFSTPFDFSAVHFLSELNPPAYKIASSELIDLPLIRLVADQKKPIIISTGMGMQSEISEAVAEVRNVDPQAKIVLLKCTAEYPAEYKDVNLPQMWLTGERNNCAFGLSDHTPGSIVPVIAASNGALVIEKHITLDKKNGGVDSHFSMEVHEFATMIKEVKTSLQIVKNLGNDYLSDGEKNSKKYRKSLIFVKDIHKGAIIGEEDVKILRPAIGLAPKFYNALLGKKVNKNITAGSPVKWEDLD